MDLRRKQLLVGAIPAAIFVPLALLLTMVPFLEPPGSVDLGERGLSGIMDHRQQIENMSNPISRAIYSFGDSSCHQNSSRSFFFPSFSPSSPWGRTVSFRPSHPTPLPIS